MFRERQTEKTVFLPDINVLCRQLPDRISAWMFLLFVLALTPSLLLT